ncbi:hypothetical protein [Nocardiopsis sp. FR26]|uniref:hypothetical protein n=1 Tax=Nocardiopsis sp. FR26 TaxID=2605987 RepID=UPI00135AE4DE|nr:hypothetical protein [Nocardiopsis sp. FR26]
MILIATLVGIATGASAMLPALLHQHRRRRAAEGRLALARAADPTERLLADVRPVRGAHRRRSR